METRKSARLILVDAAARLLLFRYADEHRPPFWATAGGELQGAESYRDAARRELREETGLDLPIGSELRRRESVYAVARSTPARWLERYYLIRCPHGVAIRTAGWTDEEQATIQTWRWWSLQAMRRESMGTFAPSWLPDLLAAVLRPGDDPAGDRTLPSPQVDPSGRARAVEPE